MTTDFPLITGISPDNVEETLNEVRRARFSTAVIRARQRAIMAPANDKEINDETLKSRENRGQK
jgi:hypothetical protein